jgi:hypothetical protein
MVDEVGSYDGDQFILNIQAGSDYLAIHKLDKAYTMD